MSTYPQVTEFEIFFNKPSTHNLTTHIVNGDGLFPLWELINFLETIAKPVGDLVNGSSFTLGKALPAGLRKDVRAMEIDIPEMTKQIMAWPNVGEWFKYINGNGETVILTFKQKIGYVAFRVSETDIDGQEAFVEVYKFSAGAVDFSSVLKAAKTLTNLTTFLQELTIPNDDIIKAFQCITTFYTDEDFDICSTENDLRKNALAIINQQCQKTHSTLKGLKWVRLVYAKQQIEILLHESDLTLQVESIKAAEGFGGRGYSCSKFFTGTAISSTPDFKADFIEIGKPNITPSALDVDTSPTSEEINAMENKELVQSINTESSSSDDIKYQEKPTDKEVVLELLDKLRKKVMSSDDLMSDIDCNESLLVNLDVISLEIEAIIERHHYLSVFNDRRQQRLTGEDWGDGISAKTMSQLNYLGQRGRDLTREDHSDEDTYNRSRERLNRCRDRDRARDIHREERRVSRKARDRDADTRWD